MKPKSRDWTKKKKNSFVKMVVGMLDFLIITFLYIHIFSSLVLVITSRSPRESKIRLFAT